MKNSVKIKTQSGFSLRHKIGCDDIIANFVFPYICTFLPYLHHMVLVNVKLDVSGYKRSIFQGCIIHSFSNSNEVGNIGILVNLL